MTVSPSEVAAVDGSLPALIVAAMLEEYGLEGTHAKIDEILDEFSIVELAAHDFDWTDFWCRPKQRPPHADFDSWGDLGGRGLGKTLSKSKFVNAEAMAGRARSICLLAQDEDNAVKLMVTGPSGLIATAPPWFKPEWYASALMLVWPNGAKAYVRTPEVPEKIRGFDYDLAWLCEIQSWSPVHREQAWMNVLIATRIGRPRICWDATPKCRHPLLKKLLRYGEENPGQHIVIRGTTFENVLNLGAGYIEKMLAELGTGTRSMREEILGEMLEDLEGATAKQEWIDQARRPKPDKFVRKCIGVDPALTKKVGNDLTGVVLNGLAADGQCCTLRDVSDQYSPDEWAKVVIDLYLLEGCDCIAAERNAAGDYIIHTLRVEARDRGLSVIELGKDERPLRRQDVVYVRTIYSRGEKADRARPVGIAYERGLISHVQGANLTELEEILTTWVPGPGERSPDRLDAHVHSVTELLGLGVNKPDPRGGFPGLRQMNTPTAPAPRHNVAWYGGKIGGKI